MDPPLHTGVVNTALSSYLCSHGCWLGLLARARGPEPSTASFAGFLCLLATFMRAYHTVRSRGPAGHMDMRALLSLAPEPWVRAICGRKGHQLGGGRLNTPHDSSTSVPWTRRCLCICVHMCPCVVPVECALASCAVCPHAFCHVRASCDMKGQPWKVT